MFAARFPSAPMASHPHCDMEDVVADMDFLVGGGDLPCLSGPMWGEGVGADDLLASALHSSSASSLVSYEGTAALG